MTQPEFPFACDMTAIPVLRRAEHLATIEKLFRSVEEIRELTNGYAFRLKNTPTILETAAEFIELERLCCPFFGFLLEARGEGEELWLTLNGRDGVKPFILAEIGNHLPAQIQPPNIPA
jgi:hypothetical protein